MHTNLMPNTPIFTADGEEIGTVKEIRGDLFKVNAPMEPDYWLACDTIASTGGAGVQLTFTRDHLNEHAHELRA